MSMTFSDIKATIMEEVELALTERYRASTEDTITLEWTLSPFDFHELLSNISTSNYFYFKNKEGTHEFLGLGEYFAFTSILDLETIEKWSMANPRWFFSYTQHFNPVDTDDVEWSDFAPFKVTLHTITFVRHNDRYSVIVLINNSDSQMSRKQSLNNIENILNLVSPGKEVLIAKESVEFPTQEEWKKLIDKAKQAMAKGEFEKVVLARKKITQYNRSIHARDLLPVLKNKGENCFNILTRQNPNALFMSMTPERLFSINNKKIEIDAIAGTRKRGHDKSSDELLAEELLTDSKELYEHRLVSEQIDRQLKEWARAIKVQRETILKLKNVQHLYTKFSAELKSGINLSTLISSLHPTAAIGGYPRAEAVDFIEDNEPFIRGLYASPMGIIQGPYIDMAVAIRSSLWKERTCHSFGGAGIVAESVAIKEWDETGKKLQSFEVID
ncbi:MAG: isochorismate synthase MenF [Bdellovibrio sp.]